MLSKLLENYDQSLKNQPLLTKSLTSGIIGFAGALVSSKIQVQNTFIFSRIKIHQILFGRKMKEAFGAKLDL